MPLRAGGEAATGEARHAAKVARIAAALRACTGGKPVSLKKRGVPHQVPKAGDLRRRDQRVNVADESTKTRREDYLRTEDYLFRYDRGVTNVRPKSFLGRALFGKLLASTEWLWLASKLPFLLRSERPTITLDMFVPFSKASEFMAWYATSLGHFPIWCVPYRRVRDYEWLTNSFWKNLGDEPLFLDLAVYGMRQHGPVNRHRLVEQELARIGGIKTLISHNYYPEAEFWSIWNRENYERVKAITDPKHLFRDLYTLTCKAAMGVE